MDSKIAPQLRQGKLLVELDRWQLPEPSRHALISKPEPPARVLTLVIRKVSFGVHEHLDVFSVNVTKWVALYEGPKPRSAHGKETRTHRGTTAAAAASAAAAAKINVFIILKLRFYTAPSSAERHRSQIHNHTQHHIFRHVILDH